MSATTAHLLFSGEFANCVMTLYLLKVHRQTFISIPITQKCQILNCDTLVANERLRTYNSQHKIGEEHFSRAFADFAKSDYLLRHVCMSICPTAWNNWAATGPIFMKFYTCLFLKICPENSSFIKVRQEWRVLYVKYDNISLNS